MQTDELILRLAGNLTPTPRRVVPQLVAAGVFVGVLPVLALVIIVLGFRPDLGPALLGAAFWMKWAYTLSLSACALAWTAALARPELPPWARAPWLLLPVLILAAAAAFEMMRVPDGHHLAVWLGHSWRICPVLIFVLALPFFFGLVLVLRQLAPTHLRVTGAAAGLASGACAASLYALHCPEAGASFILTWYSAGMLLAALGGWLAGPRLLRW